jgi:hypothetical protein
MASWSFEKQFKKGGAAHEPRLRLSAIGKDPLAHVLQAFGYNEQVLSMNTRETFHFGDMFETRAALLLASYLGATGVHYPGDNKVILRNEAGSITIELDYEVVYNEVAGHIDALVTYYDEVAPLEMKSLNGYYFKGMFKGFDDRHYIEQLMSYVVALNLSTGYFILFNKEDHEESTAILPLEVSEEERSWVSSQVSLLHDIYSSHSIEYAFDELGVPPPEKAYIKRGTVEFETVPSSLRYFADSDLFYELGEEPGSKKPKVLRVRDNAESIQLFKERYPHVST